MANPRLESRKSFMLAYIESKGPYDKVPWTENIEKLYGWARDQKVMPGFYPLGIYVDDPSTTPSEDRRTHVGISYKGKGVAGRGVQTKKVPAMTVATFSHKGPSTEFEKSYRTLNEWIRKKGYVLSGPPMEVYSKKPEVVNGVTVLYAKIMMPVKKK